MWLFAALIVLALGGIGAVAAGYGQGAREEYDDRVDTVVPAGRIRGEDLRRIRFPLAFRGYRMGEVDALLDRLAAQLEEGSAATSDSPGGGPTSDPAKSTVNGPGTAATVGTEDEEVTRVLPEGEENRG